MVGTFNPRKGEIIQIPVFLEGGIRSSDNSMGSGGGGGTFVAIRL